MSDEIKEEKKCNCYISEDYKRFLLTILASFLGCLVALCLYNASLKPQYPPQPCPVMKMGVPGFEHHRGDRPEFRHQKMNRQFEQKRFDEKKFGDRKPPVKPEK